jgi:colanic acid/amylovoran biosynthesis glycosyltransferase
MYTQVRFLPLERIEAHIVCEKTQNLNDFNVPNIHCLYDDSRLNYYWDKVIKRVGIRHHLDFLVRQVRLTGAQLVHSHFGSIGWENLGAVRKTGIKHLVTFYGQDVSRLPVNQPVWNTRYQRLFKEVDGVLCEGKFMASRVIELGCSPEKVCVQHLGVEVDQIQYLPRSWDGTGPLRILIAAGFREKKGIPDGLIALGRCEDPWR